MKPEVRLSPAALEIREVNGQPVISGYAAVFDSPSEILWGFREVIAPGAFAASIIADDIRCLWNHDSGMPLGRNRAGTLKVREDSHGLLIECSPPATSWGKDAVESIRRGDVSGMSFGFVVESPNDETWSRGADGMDIRTVRRCRCFDVSPVTYPAYPSTEVAVRALRPEDGPPDSYTAYRDSLQAVDGAKAAAELEMYEFRFRGACL